MLSEASQGWRAYLLAPSANDMLEEYWELGYAHVLGHAADIELIWMLL